MFGARAGSTQLQVPALRWTSTVVRSFGHLGGFAHEFSDAGHHRAKLSLSRIRAVCEGIRGLWPANT